MYRCQADGCGKSTEPHQPINRVVVETRPKSYEFYVNRHSHRSRRPRFNDRQEVVPHETHGSEIVKELAVCPGCFEKMTGDKARKVITPVATPRKAPGFNAKPRRKWTNPAHRGKKKSKDTKEHKPEVQVVNKVSPNEKNPR